MRETPIRAVGKTAGDRKNGSLEGPQAPSQLSDDLNEEVRYSREVFQVMVEYADAASRLKEIPFREALSSHTPFFNVLGHELPGRDKATYDALWKIWEDFIEQATPLVSANKLQDVAQIAYEKYNSLKEGRNMRTEHRFGCFHYDVQPMDSSRPGEINVHFDNRDNVGGGPLSLDKLERRKRELYEMFKEIRTLYPDENKMVNGQSWLYNLPRYRELFPIEYQESLEAVEAIGDTKKFLAAPALWMQFVKADGSVNQEMWKVFSERVARAKTEEDLTEAFPAKVLMPRGPTSAFFRMVEEYEREHPAGEGS